MSSSRDKIHALCRGSAESEPLDRQESLMVCFLDMSRQVSGQWNKYYAQGPTLPVNGRTEMQLGL